VLVPHPRWHSEFCLYVLCRRPRIQRCLGACCNCTQLVFQQWLVQVAREGEPLDPHTLGRACSLYPPTTTQDGSSRPVLKQAAWS
jgi:hypothetical protein